VQTMTEAFPVFIGVAGKRKLSNDPERAPAIEQDVRNRLGSVFDHIDLMLPVTPKILLCGGAAGADLLAAQEALWRKDGSERPNWLVLIILPFDRTLYQEDFESDQWAVFERIEKDTRTCIKVLP